MNRMEWNNSGTILMMQFLTCRKKVYHLHLLQTISYSEEDIQKKKKVKGGGRELKGNQRLTLAHNNLQSSMIMNQLIITTSA